MSIVTLWSVIPNPVTYTLGMSYYDGLVWFTNFNGCYLGHMKESVFKINYNCVRNTLST